MTHKYKQGDIVEINDDVSDSSDFEFLESLRGHEMVILTLCPESDTLCDHYMLGRKGKIIGNGFEGEFFPFIDADLKLKRRQFDF